MTQRRDLLKLLAAGAPAVMGVGIWPPALRARAQGAGLIAPNVCALMPETTEGPYYLDPALLRQDIREGRAGAPMAMRMQVVDPACAPIAGARVDIWQCDAQGNYSGFAGQGSDRALNTAGQTFLRGSQIADGDGRVEFRTIYPGWYRGRTAHLHFKVWLDRDNLLTGQIFFPDAVSTAVYAQLADYARPSQRGHITNAQDGIAQRAGPGAYAEIRQTGAGFDAALVVGVARDARSRTRRG